MKFEQRLLIYVGIIAIVIISSFFWGSPGQSINMRQAHRETEKLGQILKGDERFSNIRFLFSTANLGRLIAVKGTVRDQNSLDVLKVLVGENISPKFRIVYAIEIEGENIDAKDDPNITKLEESSEAAYIPKDLNNCFTEPGGNLEPRNGEVQRSKWMIYNPEVNLGNILTLIALLIAFFGARIWRCFDNKAIRRHIKKIMKSNLKQLKEDFTRIVEVRNKNNPTAINFAPTSIVEVSGYYFLFSEIPVSNIAQLGLSDYPKTIEFFNHYKINIETLKERQKSPKQVPNLTRPTVDRLLDFLNSSIKEFE